jgi:multidrug efflux pump subunit AcrB
MAWRWRDLLWDFTYLCWNLTKYVEVNLDYRAMQARGVTPADVITAVNAQNLILPSGTAKIGLFEYQVGINASPPAIRDLNTLPIKTVNGATIYVRDVGNVIWPRRPQLMGMLMPSSGCRL